MTANDLRRNAHVLVLQELRSRFTEAGSPSRTAALDAAIAGLAVRPPVAQSFQTDVAAWMDQCFPPALSSNMTERGDRLLEEVLELLQAHGYDSARVPTLVNYVFGRPIGEPAQEVGGVMVTLAAYCSVAGLNMQADGQAELDRINQPEVMARIRAKQEAKNALQFDTPLPGNAAQPSPAGQGDALVEAARIIANAAHDRALMGDILSGMRAHEAQSLQSAILALDAALAARRPVGQEPAAFVEHFTDRLSTLNLTHAGLELGVGKHALYAVALAQAVDLGQFRALAAKFDGLGDEEVGDAYSGPYYECARQLRALIDSQAVRNG